MKKSHACFQNIHNTCLIIWQDKKNIQLEKLNSNGWGNSRKSRDACPNFQWFGAMAGCAWDHKPHVPPRI